ncbi:MAG: hypothetical protein QOD02_4548 [Mycobacterium sp.]|nr:hypothetical protein [Mycobacterium sp.]MDT5342838.1 hypothetical protein [Mycobacterium sp.]
MREVELAAIDGSVPVDRTILVPVSHVAVIGDAEIVGVFMAVGGELCSVEGQTIRDVGDRDGGNNRRRTAINAAAAILGSFVQCISSFPFQNHQGVANPSTMRPAVLHQLVRQAISAPRQESSLQSCSRFLRFLNVVVW